MKQLRDLPRVDDLAALHVGGRLPEALIVEVARSILDEARAVIAAGGEVDVEAAMADAIWRVEESTDRPVINATGVLLHTNLGRAPLSERAVGAMAAVAGYSNLEIDLATGERGGRGLYVTRLLRTLTGADDALVVNNNAAGLLISLAALSSGRSVPVARGELIEIGGSYRLPRIMEVSGARLAEVGTTNRTRIGDFQTAVQIHECGAILKVHPSNYRVVGFSEEAGLHELADLAHLHGLPLIHDVGSGLLDGRAAWLGMPAPDWLRDEPAVIDSIGVGADLVTFSGDKLLGGPQAGIIVGSGEAIARIRTHPLARALRVDAITYAALSATLEAYLEGRVAEIPFWRRALLTAEALEERSRTVAEGVGGHVVTGRSLIGAGSVPGAGIPGPQIVVRGASNLFARLLSLTPAIATRRVAGDLMLDLRAVDPADDAVIMTAVQECL